MTLTDLYYDPYDYTIGDEPCENIPMMIMKDPPEHTRPFR